MGMYFGTSRADRWPRRDICGIPRRRSPFARRREIYVSSNSLDVPEMADDVQCFIVHSYCCQFTYSRARDDDDDVISWILHPVPADRSPEPARIAHLRPRHPVYLAHLHASNIKIRKPRATRGSHCTLSCDRVVETREIVSPFTSPSVYFNWNAYAICFENYSRSNMLFRSVRSKWMLFNSVSSNCSYESMAGASRDCACD